MNVREIRLSKDNPGSRHYRFVVEIEGSDVPVSGRLVVPMPEDADANRNTVAKDRFVHALDGLLAHVKSMPYYQDPAGNADD